MHYLKDFLVELLETINSAVVFVDKEGKILLYNRKVMEITGLKRKEISGRFINDVFPESKLMDCIRNGEYHFGQKVKLKGSTYIVYRRPVYHNGEIIGGLSVFHDISEQEELQASLDYAQKLNHQLESIINSSYDGIYITDAQGNGIKVNKAYERITGVKPEELLGKNMKQVVDEGIVSESVSLKVIATKKPVTIVQNVRGKEVLVTGNPVFDEEGRLINVVTNIRDISELNKLKQDLEKTKALSEKYFSELTRLRQKEKENEAGEIVAYSKEMKQIIYLARRLGQVDSSVLILGESGVGKEVIAQLIHESGKRKKHPFIKVNCGAIPHNLLESELFGYEAGAFTGANRRGKPGLFELADRGTLFLDEVGDLPLDLQVKLLRAVQNLEITRVGGTKTIHVDVRIISATNKNLEKMVEDGTFRQDLYYRLNIVPIKIPPLRERTEDIIPLTYFFLNKINQKYGMKKKMSPELLKVFQSYHWPGNIRELENLIERLVVTTEEETITPDDFPSEMVTDSFITPESPRPLKEILQDVERGIIARALKKYKTTRKTAEVLGVDQSTLVRKIKRLHIPYPH
ncbi:MAG: hypothetical protein BAA01_10985 [Bacillus thermozeamaize]|uniref:HTH-type transcriptional regulatory protein TyrR n=1 Tax=Bacillus thermozeamaize TaxID=230954 RepID=A0A1Y3PUE6_9BACI|nr:MAG: hypothetical protein BAA01_10985 [Bacillus thermozeamaize]